MSVTMSPNRWLAACLVVHALACADATGPTLPPGTLLAAGRGPLEWSRDGRTIYYNGDPTVGGHIFTVDVITHTSRLVVNCAMLPVETIAGLAYTTCVSPPVLHLVSEGHDSILSTAAFWFMRSEDRMRLLYLGEDVNGVNGGFDTLHVVDFARGTQHSTTTRLNMRVAAVAPSGTEMFVQSYNPSFLLVNVDNSTQRVLQDSILNNFIYEPRLIGWNDAGVWIFRHGLGIYDPVTGTWRSGGTGGLPGNSAVVERPGRRAALWSATCLGEDSAGCVRGLFMLHVVDPLRNAPPLQILRFETEDVQRYARGIEGVAFSPDGQSLAYTFGNELRLVALPGN